MSLYSVDYLAYDAISWFLVLSCLKTILLNQFFEHSDLLGDVKNNMSEICFISEYVKISDVFHHISCNFGLLG